MSKKKSSQPEPDATHSPNSQPAEEELSLLESAAHTAAAVVGVVGGVVYKVGETVVKTGETMVKASAEAGQAIGEAASHTGEAVLRSASDAGDTAWKQSHGLIAWATQGTGQALDFISDSSLIRKLTETLRLDWLVGASDTIDLQKAETAVSNLKQKYPDESPGQIAHRVMLEKAIYAGGVGLATSLLPGQAIAFLAVDLATTAALQTEMVYQIAAAYGLDLNDPARRGEVLAIFGLALGGGRAVKAGLTVVRNIPFAGALIGASANASILYALGYAARQFYEAKQNPNVEETSAPALEEIKHKSELYLQVAMAQQALVDQILAHMVLASYPEQTWENILPTLESLNIDPNSLETIATHLHSPQPLGALLQQLNRDFAVLTLSRCYAIAQLDGEISAAESTILEALAEKFDLELAAIAAIATRQAAD